MSPLSKTLLFSILLLAVQGHQQTKGYLTRREQKRKHMSSFEISSQASTNALTQDALSGEAEDKAVMTKMDHLLKEELDKAFKEGQQSVKDALSGQGVFDAAGAIQLQQTAKKPHHHEEEEDEDADDGGSHDDDTESGDSPEEEEKAVIRHMDHLLKDELDKAFKEGQQSGKDGGGLVEKGIRGNASLADGLKNANKIMQDAIDTAFKYGQKSVEGSGTLAEKDAAEQAHTAPRKLIIKEVSTETPDEDAGKDADEDASLVEIGTKTTDKLKDSLAQKVPCSGSYKKCWCESRRRDHRSDRRRRRTCGAASGKGCPGDGDECLTEAKYKKR